MELTCWPSRHVRVSLEERFPGKLFLRGVGRDLGHVTRENDVGATRIFGVQVLPGAVQPLGKGHRHGGTVVHLSHKNDKSKSLECNKMYYYS